jgi:hypothetical protein
MGRPWFAVFCTAAALTAGCKDTGGYTLSWSFATEGPQTGCGAHGVDSIRVTGASMEGDGDDGSVLCAAGSINRGVAVGTWTFMVHQLDVRGQEIVVVQLDANGQTVPDATGQPTTVANPTVAASIGKDQSVMLDPVMLTARPTCADGVDNDGDGRVDLDDPKCGNDLNSTAE